MAARSIVTGPLLTRAHLAFEPWIRISASSLNSRARHPVSDGLSLELSHSMETIEQSRKPEASFSGEADSAASRESGWLHDVVLKNYRLLFATAFRIVRNAHTAEDVTQNALIKALQQAHLVRDRSAAVGWLTSITRHTAL